MCCSSTTSIASNGSTFTEADRIAKHNIANPTANDGRADVDTHCQTHSVTKRDRTKHTANDGVADVGTYRCRTDIRANRGTDGVANGQLQLHAHPFAMVRENGRARLQ
jgi:hypothetical protein